MLDLDDLKESWGTVNSLITVLLLKIKLYKMMMFFRSVHLEILKLRWYSFPITVKLKQHTLVLMLSLVTGLSECSGTILTDNRTIRWVSVNLSQNFKVYRTLLLFKFQKFYCAFYFVATTMTVEND